MPNLPNAWILETRHTAYVLGLDADGSFASTSVTPSSDKVTRLHLIGRHQEK